MERPHWDRYIQSLTTSNIFLSDKEYDLLWVKNVNRGSCVPKLGYLALREEEELPLPRWWCKIIWHMKCPYKIKILFWIVLEGKVLIWDELVHRLRCGPSRCPLCFLAAENITHLFHVLYMHDGCVETSFSSHYCSFFMEWFRY